MADSGGVAGDPRPPSNRKVIGLTQAVDLHPSLASFGGDLKGLLPNGFLASVTEANVTTIVAESTSPALTEYEVQPTDFVIFVDCSNGPLTLYLPLLNSGATLLLLKLINVDLTSPATSLEILPNDGSSDTIPIGSPINLTTADSGVLLFGTTSTGWYYFLSEPAAITGDVRGTPPSTAKALARYLDTSGLVIENSLVNADDSGHVTPATTAVQNLGAIGFNWLDAFVQNFLSDADLTFQPGSSGNEYHNDQNGNPIFEAFVNSAKQYFASFGFSLFGSPRTVSARVNIETSAYDVVGQIIRAHTTTGSVVVPATGGTIVHTGGYYIHTFTSNGNFVIPSGCSPTFGIEMAGGAGAGMSGGGGAGGVIQIPLGEAISAGTFPVVIGPGGTGGTNGNPSTHGGNGTDTTFNGHTAVGGGGGSGTNANDAQNGGSGGGGGADGGSNEPGGTGTGGQGSNGGHSDGGHPNYGAGGGGGAGAVGANATTSAGGNGGVGVPSIVPGSSNYLGGGGGGGCYGPGTGGTGGNGGGGAGSGTGNGTNGTANTGGGGGGAQNNGTSGNGGSGVVVIWYPDTTGDLNQTADLLQTMDDSGAVLSAVIATGDITTQVAGVGLQIKEGSNAKQGTATLVLGTVTVSNTSVTANSRIFICGGALNSSTALGDLSITSQTAATGFVITSYIPGGVLTQVGDLRTVNYEIFEPS